MKKLIFAAAAVAGMGAFALESANVVGYNTTAPLAADATAYAFTLVGLPFESVGGNGNISLNDLQISNLTGALSPTKSDQIWLWVADSEGNYNYETWRYRNAANGWLRMSDSAKFQEVYPNGIPAGTAFWFASYNTSAEKTLTTSGAVAKEDTEVTLVRGQFQFVSYPYPTNLKLNDSSVMDCSNCVGALSPTKSDQIWFWIADSEGNYNYETWRYRNASNGWLRMSDSAKFQDVYPNGVPVGAGFWYSSYDNGASETYTITFKSPITE